MSQTYFAILTAVGEAKDANAKALGTPIVITHMAVGDGGGVVPVPVASRTTLFNEVRRAPLNQLSRDPVNLNQVIAEQVIPENVGGWWIREIGLIDEDGDLIAIANCPPTYKPQLAEGSGRTQVVRMVLIVSGADAVQLKIDPGVVLATRKYADDAITASMAAHLAAADPHTQYKTKNLTVLNKNVAGGADVVLTDAEARHDIINLTGALTANINVVVPASAREWTVKNSTTGAFVPTMKTPAGAGLAIAQGSTRIFYCDGVAVRSSIDDIGEAIGTTPAQFDNSKKLVTTAFLKRHGVQLSDQRFLVASTVLTAADIGSLVETSAPAGVTHTLPLANSVPKGASILFLNNGGFDLTVAAQGGNVLDIGSRASFKIAPGESLLVVSNSSTKWLICGGTAANAVASSLGFSTASSGYQRLPSGLIIQWRTANASRTGQPGISTNWPIAFPTACLHLVAMHIGSDPAVNITSNAYNATSFSLMSNYAATDVGASTIGLGY